MRCLECDNSTAYLQNKVCVPYGSYASQATGAVLSLSTPNCRTGDPAGLCLSCLPGYLYNTQTQTCSPYPAGLAPCASFDGVSCVACGCGYLRGGFCCDFGLYHGNWQCLTIPVAHCDVYDGVSCQTCQANYYLVSNVCCRLGQYLSQGACVDGAALVPFCRLFDAGGLCTRCSENYVLLQTSPIGRVCLPMSSQMNCNAAALLPLTQNGVVTAVYDCSLCVNETTGFYNTLDSSGRKYSVTVPDNSIPNCNAYDFAVQGGFAQLVCVACKTGYYLSAGSCLARMVIANCTLYDPRKDECVQCAAGCFLLSATVCQPLVDSFDFCASPAK